MAPSKPWEPTQAWVRACQHFGFEKLQNAEFVGRVNSVTKTITWEKDRFSYSMEPRVVYPDAETFQWFWERGENDPDLFECRWIILTRATERVR